MLIESRTEQKGIISILVKCDFFFRIWKDLERMTCSLEPESKAHKSVEKSVHVFIQFLYRLLNFFFSLLLSLGPSWSAWTTGTTGNQFINVH